MSEFKWYIENWPLVTQCCGSFRWANVISNDQSKAGIICYNCDTFSTSLHTDVRPATPEDYSKSIGRPVTQEQMEQMFEPLPIQQTQ